jgi:HK97 family phage major capsid protein
MMIPKDETTPWQTSGGVQVYWEGEAQAPAASKPSFEMGALRLAKLMALVPISEELMQDASGLESWLRAKAPSKMAAKVNTAIVAGTGVGQPLGIIPGYTAVGASVVQVSKATSQPADTIWMANIEDMYARMYAPWRRNAVWLINQDLEPQLGRMAFQAAGASSLLPGHLGGAGLSAAGRLSNSPYATLKGRPVVPIEACSAIGDLGDIIFVDLAQYWALTKAGGIQTDTSIHLYFDQALTRSASSSASTASRPGRATDHAPERQQHAVLGRRAAGALIAAPDAARAPVRRAANRFPRIFRGAFLFRRNQP